MITGAATSRPIMGRSREPAIYRALKKNKDGTESQDRAFNLATQNFHYPKTNLVNLESATTQPVAFPTSRILGAPGWRERVRNTPLAKDLFPLHNPVNYVKWLGTQKKRLVVVGDYDGNWCTCEHTHALKAQCSVIPNVVWWRLFLRSRSVFSWLTFWIRLLLIYKKNQIKSGIVWIVMRWKTIGRNWLIASSCVCDEFFSSFNSN